MLQRDLVAGNYTLAMLQRGLLIKAAQNAVTAVTTTTTTTTTTKAAGRKKREEEGNVAISNTVVFANAMSLRFTSSYSFKKCTHEQAYLLTTWLGLKKLKLYMTTDPDD